MQKTAMVLKGIAMINLRANGWYVINTSSGADTKLKKKLKELIS